MVDVSQDPRVEPVARAICAWDMATPDWWDEFADIEDKRWYLGVARAALEAAESAAVGGVPEPSRDAAREAIAYVRSHYDESIFPPHNDGQPGPHSEVYDGEAASVARLTCDNILREYQERLGDDT